jgi:hypothetical protein
MQVKRYEKQRVANDSTYWLVCLISFTATGLKFQLNYPGDPTYDLFVCLAHSYSYSAIF